MMVKTFNPDYRLLCIIFGFLMYLLFDLVSFRENNDHCVKLIYRENTLCLTDCDENVPGGSSHIGANLTPLFFKKMPINSATREELETINGIGPHLAKNIIDYRNQHGPIDDVNELCKINGIGDKRSRYLLRFVSF